MQEPVHTRAVNSWRDSVPKGMTEAQMIYIAPLLKTLGYVF